MIAEQMLEGSALYPNIDPDMLVTTGRIVSDNLDIGPDFTDAYWLGWINFDNLPVDYRLSNFTINGDTVTLTDITEQKNYDIGYTVGNANNPAYKAGVIRYEDEDVRWLTWDNQEPDTEAQSFGMRLCNQVDINRQGVTRIVPIFAINPMDSGGVSKSYTMAFCVVEAPTFLKDDTWTAEATIVDLRGASGISGTVTFSASDIDGTVHTRVLGGVNCEYFCCGFQIENSNWTVYNANTQQYEFTTIQSTLRPFLALEANGYDGKFVVNSAEAPFNNGFSLYYGAGYTYNQRYGFLWQYNQNPYVYQSKPFNSTEGLIAGNFEGSFSAAAVRERFPSTGTYGFYGVDGANFILQSTGIYEYVMLRRLYSIDEIRKTMSLYPRIIAPGFADYVNYDPNYLPLLNYNPIYAEVSEDNEFLTDTVTGRIPCQLKLKAWQRIGQRVEPDIAPYDTADKPEYIPSGGEAENTGESIIRPSTLGVGGTNGFITQYALDASQVAEIGRLLWLNFTNADYYKNFLFTLSTTGTINISELLNYFISLRVYPFSLLNVPSYDAAGNDMYIGAGFVPLHFTDPIHTINNYADYIDAGTCYIPRHYNDFRDFVDTEVMLFLPYCGTMRLNAADVVGGTLHVQYAIDFASGGVNAYVDLTTHDGYQYPIGVMSGCVGADIPLTASNATQIAARIASGALNFANIFEDAEKSSINNGLGIAAGALTGNVPGIVGGAVNEAYLYVDTANKVAQTALNAPQAKATAMPMMAGGRGFGAFGQPTTAYVQIRRGLYAEGKTPSSTWVNTFAHATDKPITVGSCKGFTQFSNVDVSGLSCTSDERSQIKALLESGVYI